jgi:hypothetical protein
MDGLCAGWLEMHSKLEWEAKKGGLCPLYRGIVYAKKLVLQLEE